MSAIAWQQCTRGRAGLPSELPEPRRVRPALQVARSGGRRVVLLGLSLGASYGAAFLASPLLDDAWREAHVERLVTISGGRWGLGARMLGFTCRMIGESYGIGVRWG